MPEDSPVISSVGAESCLVVLVTTETEEEAAKIARLVVTEKLAACVNIVNPIRSIYRWEGQVAEGRESLMMIKTTQARFDALQQRILELHSYETPEIIALPLARGLDAYMGWLADSTR